MVYEKLFCFIYVKNLQCLKKRLCGNKNISVYFHFNIRSSFNAYFKKKSATFLGSSSMSVGLNQPKSP